MRSTLIRAARRGGVVVAAVAAITTLTATAAPTSVGSPAGTRVGRTAAGHVRSVRVERGGPDATIRFSRLRAGQAFVTVTTSAQGVSWGTRHHESAVVSAYVDGHYATDIVIMSSSPVTRQYALGRLGVGRHTLRLHYAARRSARRAGTALLRGIGFHTVVPGTMAYAAARYAPVLYGRNIPGHGGRFQNNHTDTPLVAWHQVLPATTPGHSLIEYSVMWSNEDGGTDSGALMAEWGRTTDIEWVYRVEVDAQGVRVPGTGVIQAPLHQTLPFGGRYDGTHPLIETCTSNNNVCDKVDDPMRFALSTREALPTDQPREHEMDRHPWTYQVMAREMLREHRIESPSDPATSAVGDQRSYLYVAVDHVTVPSTSASDFGLAVEVRLKGDPTTYTSNHGFLLWTINRDGPAATTVELPLGTTGADVASISVSRLAIGTDDGSTLTVTGLGRAFFLNKRYLPRPSFASWHGNLSLTTGDPTRELWPAA